MLCCPSSHKYPINPRSLVSKFGSLRDNKLYHIGTLLSIQKWLPSFISDTFVFLFQDKKILNIYKPDGSVDSNDDTVVGGLASEAAGVDEEAPLIPSSRLSYVTRTQTGGGFNSR